MTKYDGGKLSNPMDEFVAMSEEEKQEKLAKMSESMAKKDAENFDAVTDMIAAQAVKFKAFGGYYDAMKTADDIDVYGDDIICDVLEELIEDIEDMGKEWAELGIDEASECFDGWLDKFVNASFVAELKDLRVNGNVNVRSLDSFKLYEALICQVCQQLWPVLRDFGQQHAMMTAEYERFESAL